MTTRAAKPGKPRSRAASIPGDDGHAIFIGRSKHRRAPSEVKKLTKICAGTSAILRKRSASQRPGSRGMSSQNRDARPSLQRAAVRVTYAVPKGEGHWKAHGVYIQREAAAGAEAKGFTSTEDSIDAPTTLDAWQKADDPRMFRIILSPEEGSKLNMKEYTRAFMKRAELELGKPLDYVAVVHTNTDHPHAHIALRGIDRDGEILTIPKDYIRAGFRNAAQEIATRKLGYRTKEQIERQAAQEITSNRVTPLDRLIARSAEAGADLQNITIDTKSSQFANIAKSRAGNHTVQRRLIYLNTIGLSTTDGSKWTLPKDFAEQLRALQTAGDRQKMMSRDMAPASSTDQPIRSTKWAQITHLDARILGHGEDDQTGKRYMIVEDTEGTVHHINHRDSTERLRQTNGLARNSFATFERDSYNRLIVKDHGNADALLKNRTLLKDICSRASIHENRPGWLGRFDSALKKERERSGSERDTYIT